MDIGAALIILAITALIVLPFLLMFLNKKRKYIKFQQNFMNLAQRGNITFSLKEIWNHRYAIGIDNNSKKIMYVNKKEDEAEPIIINLSEVAKCRVVSINKTVKNQYGSNALTDRLELVFTFRNSEIPEKILEFYESTEFMPNDEERSHIEKWLQIVNLNLNNGKI
jgi:hypothetical protein